MTEPSRDHAKIDVPGTGTVDPSAPSSEEAGRPGRTATRSVGRIAMVTEFYYPHLGGVCEHVHFLSAELRRRGWDVDVVTGAMKGAVEDPHVVRLGRSVSVYANRSHARITVGRRLRDRVRSVLEEGRYDLVHVHAPLAPVLPILAVQEASVPVVGTFHTPLGRNLVYRWGRGYFQPIVDRLSAAVAVSPPAAAGFARYFQTSWDIIPNGVDIHEFHADVPRPPALDDDVPTLLFLGRLDPRNGLGTTLKAFSRLQRAMRHRPLRLVVVGGGPLRRLYEFRARGRGDVRFVGPVLEERPRYYAHSDVYVYPTTRGTFGITLLEAMACQAPVICTDLPAFAHVVRDGQEGFLTPAGDVGALAERARQLLENAPLRERMGRAGRARAQEFSWSRVANQVEELYSRVLGERAGA